MKIFTNNHGVAHLAVLLLISVAAVGFVGWASYNAWQSNDNDYSSTEPANNLAEEKSQPMTDEQQVEAIIKSEESCGAEQVLRIGKVVVYKGFAKAEVGCMPAGTGATSIFKLMGGEWTRISGTQNCLDPILKTRYMMSKEIKARLFPEDSYCVGP